MIDNEHINSEIKPYFFENIRYTSNYILIFIGLILLVKVGYDLYEGAKIFGHKNIAFFDAWSIEHVITGMSLSYFFLLFKGPFSRAMKKDDEWEILKLENDPKYSPEQKRGILRLLRRKSYKSKIIHHSLVVVSIAFAWEVIELYMETATFSNYGIEYYFLIAQEWFSGVELFLNRFVVDVFLVYLGWYLIRHKPILAAIAPPLSLFWLLIHIFVFKDSMFLHESSFAAVITAFFSVNTIWVLLVTILLYFITNKFKGNLRTLSMDTT